MKKYITKSRLMELWWKNISKKTEKLFFVK